jgi:5S rRNA maturation endonuclease (ribonuclease M5)
MIATMQKQSHSYDQNKLKIMCDKLCDQFESLLEALDIDGLESNGKMFVGNCPIHSGDNKTAFNLYPDGESYRGNWKCRTHGCDKIFKGSIIGFIRGVLSNKEFNWRNSGDKIVSFEKTISFIEQFLGNKLNKISISNTDIEKNKFSSIIKNLVINETVSTNTVSRQQIRKSLIFPCQYFIDRGFSQQILDKYDVGICNKKGKEMYNRAVVPIYDHNHKYMVGCSGRSIFDKCALCSSYHSKEDICPEEKDQWKFSKWKHNYGFMSQNHLYNLWFAKKHIAESNKVILVESPGNVWRLEEAGIHNAVAIFGSNLSDKQKILLDGSGAMTIITIMDSDDAGINASKTIYDKCKNTYNISSVNISKPDIAEMSIEEINKEIRDHL